MKKILIALLGVALFACTTTPTPEPQIEDGYTAPDMPSDINSSRIVKIIALSTLNNDSSLFSKITKQEALEAMTIDNLTLYLLDRSDVALNASVANTNIGLEIATEKRRMPIFAAQDVTETAISGIMLLANQLTDTGRGTLLDEQSQLSTGVLQVILSSSVEYMTFSTCRINKEQQYIKLCEYLSSTMNNQTVVVGFIDKTIIETMKHHFKYNLSGFRLQFAEVANTKETFFFLSHASWGLRKTTPSVIKNDVVKYDIEFERL